MKKSRPIKKLNRAISLFLILLISYSVQGQTEETQNPGKNLKIAFVSYKTGTADVFLMNSDGTNVEQITDTHHQNSFPFQIDNRTIGYTRTDSTNKQQKFKIDIVTKEEEPLVQNPVVENAKWEVISDNRKSIAFIRSKDYSDRELYIYDTETQREIKISDKELGDYKALSVGYSWSENGKYLIFMSGPDWYNQYVRLYDVENEKVSTVTNRGYMNSGIRWLNDNKTLIANLKIKDETLYEIYHIDILTGKLTQLTDGKNLHPDVSPDGEWIVFETQRHENYGEVYIMKKDGTDQRRLTRNDNYNGRAAWFKLDSDD